MLKPLTQRIFFLLLLLLAIQSSATPSEVLQVQFSSEPSQLDPLVMEDGIALRLAANIIASTMELLDSSKTNKTFTEFTFIFKPNLKWSDGVPFESSHFLNALKRLSSAKIKVALSVLFPKIDFIKTEVKNAREIKVILEKSDPLFLEWCTLPPFAPIREDMIAGYEQKPTLIVPTLAPYKVVSTKRDTVIELEKNENYFDAKTVAVKKVRILILKDEQSILPLLTAKKLDIVTRVPVLQLKSIERIAKIANVPVAATTYLGLNSRVAPFNEVMNRVRMREVLVSRNDELSHLLKTDELAARQFIPAILGGEITTNMNQVNQPTLYAKKLVFQTDQGSRNQNIMEYVQHQLKKNDFPNLEIETLDWREHLARLKSDSPVAAAFRLGWQNPVEHPYVFYQVLASDSPNNFTGWKSAEYDLVLQKLKSTASDRAHLKERKDLMIKLEEILAREAPVVPLLHQVLKFAYSKRVRGFRANPFGVILFREIRLDKN